MAGVALQPCEEIIEAESEGVGTGAAEKGRRFREILEAPELAHIIVEENTAIERQNRTRVLAALGIPEQLARHSEMDKEQAAVKIEENLFAAAAHTLDDCARQAARRLRMIAPRNALRTDFGMPDSSAGHVFGNGPNDCFYFRKFRQWSGEFHKNVPVLYNNGVGLDLYIFIGII